MVKSLSVFRYPKPVLYLACVEMLTLAGFSFLWPLTTLYVTHVLGRSLTTAGVVLSAEAAAGIVGSFFGGLMHDRVGGKRAILLSCVVVVLSNVLLAASRQWGLFLIGFLGMTLFLGVLLTSLNAEAGTIWPAGGRKPFTLIYVCKNIGVALGTALGGAVASVSFTYSFCLIALFFALAGGVTVVGLRDMGKVGGHSVDVAEAFLQDENVSSHMTEQRKGLVTLLLLCIGMTFNLFSYIQWQTTMPIYLQQLGFSSGMYSLLWTLNGLLVIGLQPLSHWIGNRFPGEMVPFWLGQTVFILSFLLLIGVDREGYGRFVGAMILATAGEILIWPAVPAVAFRIAPDRRKGFYLGILNAFTYGGRLLGPVVGTVLYQYKGPSAMLAVMVLFYVLALVSFAISPHMRRAPAHTNTLPSRNSF